MWICLALMAQFSKNSMLHLNALMVTYWPPSCLSHIATCILGLALALIIIFRANMSQDVPPVPSASCTPCSSGGISSQHSACLHTNTSTHMCVCTHTHLHAHHWPAHSGSAAGELLQPLSPAGSHSEQLHRAGAYMPHHMHTCTHIYILYA